MKRILCFLMALLILMLPLSALAQAQAGAPGRPGGGAFRPGAALLSLLRALDGGGRQGVRGEMPDGDWAGLLFMLGQGLAQYGLTAEGDLAMDAPEAYGGDAALHLSAGQDDDGCFAVDGDMTVRYDDGGGAVQALSDGLFLRRNDRTGEQRVKLPFEPELEGFARADDAPTLLMRSLLQDQEHWAAALDIAYEKLYFQPELTPLMRVVFDGGALPDSYVLDSNGLLAALRRTLKGLSADAEFASAIAGTKLLEALELQGATGLDVASMTRTERGLLVSGALALASGQLENAEIEGPPAMLSLRRLPAGFELVGSFENEDGVTIQLGWKRGADGDHLHYSRTEWRYGETLVVTLDAGSAGVSLAFGNPLDGDAARGTLGIWPAGDGYALQGEIKSYGARTTLEGACTAEAGARVGEFAMHFFDEQHPDGVELLTAGYRFHEEALELYYNFSTEAVEDNPTRAALALQLSSAPGRAAGRLRFEVNGEGFETALALDPRSDAFAGSVTHNLMTGGRMQPLLNGDFLLSPGALRCDLTLDAENMAIPVKLTAGWNDEALDARLDVAPDGFTQAALSLAAKRRSGAWRGTLSAEAGQQIKLLDFAVGPRALGVDMAKGAAQMLTGDGDLPDVKLWCELDPANLQLSALTHGEYGDEGYALSGTAQGLPDGCAFDIRLAVLANGEEQASLGLTGEHHQQLNMASPTPFTMAQRADYVLTTAGATARGSVRLDHAVRVGEREHKEPDAGALSRTVNGRAGTEPGEPPAVEAPPEGDEDEALYDRAHYQFTLEPDGAYITGYTGELVDLLIPEALGGSAVVGIAEGAFAGMGRLESVQLPTGLREIRGAAFKGCTALVWAFLQNELTGIAPDAFEGTEALILGFEDSLAQRFCGEQGIEFAAVDAEFTGE